MNVGRCNDMKFSAEHLADTGVISPTAQRLPRVQGTIQTSAEQRAAWLAV